MLDFLSGAITMGCGVAGLFFFRFWGRTGDTLFAYFGFSFWLLAASQALLVVLEIPNESQSWIYLLRFCAFLVLIVGIIAKNLRRSRPGDSVKG